MASAPHGGAWPQDLPAGVWLVYVRGTRRCWEEAPQAWVAEPEPLPVLLRVCGVAQAEGVYALVGGESWRGHAVWADAADERRIYTVEKGCWIVGPTGSMGVDAGWAMTASEHGGRLPCEVTEWVVLDGRGGWTLSLGVGVALADDHSGPGDGLGPFAAHKAAVRRLFSEFAVQSTGMLHLGASLNDVLRRIAETHGAVCTAADLDSAVGSLPLHPEHAGLCDLAGFSKLLYLLFPRLNLAFQEHDPIDVAREL